MKKTKDLPKLQRPPDLSPKVAQEWDRLVSELTVSGVQLTSWHRAAVENAATIAADILEATEQIAKDGPYIRGSRGLVLHPATRRLDALRRDLVTVLKVFNIPKPRQTDGPKLADLLL